MSAVPATLATGPPPSPAVRLEIGDPSGSSGGRGSATVGAGRGASSVGLRLANDGLAVRFLPRSQQLLVRACRWSCVQWLLTRATDGQAHGLWAGILCRKRYADDRVSEGLDAGSSSTSSSAPAWTRARTAT